jgi:hypothetical protein
MNSLLNLEMTYKVGNNFLAKLIHNFIVIIL